ncbi:MAG: LPS assembly protein LptD [Acidobacteriota bacterium]|nr:LPS assembly protein LptD [Acidobacteriota bacterium]
MGDLPKPDFKTRPPRPDKPNLGDYNITADTETKDGDIYKFRGRAVIEGSQMILKADEIDYNQETGDAEARGHVYFQHFERNEIIVCSRAKYNTETETGRFDQPRGYAKTQIHARPGMLASDNPFYFEGEWAERDHEKYILYNGMITGCVLPNPWWTLTGPKFDIIPDDRALAYKAVFRLRKVPLFYAPVFRKSLSKEPRQSGFLTPNVGNSSRRGAFFGLGYYWAINRSYDVTYRVQDFTQRGLAHHIDFRGKPTQSSDFDVIFYGVQDRGIQIGNTLQKQGGFNLYATGHADLGNGWTARGNINYLSSLVFRQNFTESFNEAIFSESHSTGYVTKHHDSYTFNTVFSRIENFQDALKNDVILIRKLPEVQFGSRDHELTGGLLPLWGSFDSAAGLLYRTQAASITTFEDGSRLAEGKLQTQQFSRRANLEPRVMTALRFKNFHLIPSFTLHETYYSEQFENGRVVSNSLLRNAREVSVDFVMPSVERLFKHKTWLGDQLKHVIEPRATYRYVTGVGDYERVIRFDQTDLLTNTNEVELSITNRLYAKRGDAVSEVATLEVYQKRFFDPTFGGAVISGERNVVLSTVDLTGYTFLYQPRNYSPVVIVFRAYPRPGFGLEWLTDYDPLLGRIVNSGFNANYRRAKYFLSAGNNQVRSIPALSPSANQLRGVFGYGDPNRRGWNTAVTAIYDYKNSVLQFATVNLNYNTDCCGISVQYRRFSFVGIGLNDNQFRVSFSIANVGSFGTLKKQERLF